MGGHDGWTMIGGTPGGVVTVGSGMHHILRGTAYIPLPCGLHTGPILLTWHINDLKGPMMAYDNLIYLYTTLKDAANDVWSLYCLDTVSSFKC
jgi:hypothetical protein